MRLDIVRRVVETKEFWAISNETSVPDNSARLLEDELREKKLQTLATFGGGETDEVNLQTCLYR